LMEVKQGHDSLLAYRLARVCQPLHHMWQHCAAQQGGSPGSWPRHPASIKFKVHLVHLHMQQCALCTCSTRDYGGVRAL
jgi:hypothetical protein